MQWYRMCREEVLAVVTRPAIFATAVALACVSVASMIQSQGDVDDHREQYREQLQERVQAQLRIVAPSGRSVDPGLRVLRPPTATRILVRGRAAAVLSAWDFGPSGVDERPPYTAQGTRLVAAVSLDFEGIVLVFGGLLSVAFGLYRVVADRGSHWSRAVRVLPVPWRALVAARLAAGIVVVAFLLGIWLAIVAMVVGVVEPASATELRWVLLRLSVPTLLYLVTLHTVGLASALRYRSALSAVVMGVIGWLLITFIVPLGLAVTSRTAVPRLTRHALERERQEAYADEFRRFEDAIGRTIAAHVPAGPILQALADIDEPVVKDLNLEAAWQAGVAEARQLAARFELEWDTHVARQRAFQNTSVALSPASALTAGLAELAGVGDADAQAWDRAARTYHAALAAAVFDDRPIANTRIPVGNSFPTFALNRHPPKRYAALPVFQAPDVSEQARWQSARGPLGWLLLHAALALMVAYRAGIRDLRQGATTPHP